MGTNITTSAVFGSLPTNRPDDLDDAYMDGGPYPLWPILQELANRSDFFQRVIYGLLTWSGRVDIAGLANTGVIGVTVGMIEAIALKDTAPDPDVWRVSSVPETALNIGGTVLANNTWYNIYAYISGGVVTYEVSTTGVNSSGIWKSGAADTHRWVTTFRTDSGGIPIPGTFANGQFTYRAPQLNVFQNASLAGAATELVTLASRVPSQARVATVFVTLTGTGSYFRSVGDSGGDTTTPVFAREMQLDSSQRAEWGVPVAVTGSIAVGVRSYRI